MNFTYHISLAIILLSLVFDLNHSYVYGNDEDTDEDNRSENENDEFATSNSNDVFSASSDIAQMLTNQEYVASIVHQFIRSEMQRLNTLSR